MVQPPVDPAREREKITRVTKNLKALDRDWRQLRWLGLGVLLAAPAGLAFGLVAAGITVVVTLWIYATAWYLVRGHRYEYERELEEARRRLASVSPPSAPQPDGDSD